jgi:hypothetical protein
MVSKAARFANAANSRSGWFPLFPLDI